MASTINASTSPAAIVQTADGTANLSLQSNGTTIAAITSTGIAVTGTGSVTGDLSFNSGYGSAAVAYGCRAWVNFNGTGTVAIRGSANVSSITDNGLGNYVVNLTTSMPDANYSVGINTDYDGTANAINAKTFATGSFLIQSILPNFSNYVDKSIITCQVFR